jgi:hypothetical protein
MSNYRKNSRNDSTFAGILLCLFMIVFSGNIFSQNLKTNFIKQSINQDAGSIVFNVVKIINNKNSSVIIKPVLLLPKGWAVFSTNLKDTIIQANGSISLAFRIRIPQNAISDIPHNINFQIFSDQNKLILQNDFSIKTNPFHDWNIIVPKNRIYFLPGNDNATFEIKITNNGNTKEIISLDFNADKKIELTSANELDVPDRITINPGHDTTLSLVAKYTFSEDRIFDMSKIQIFASSGETRVYRTLIIEKYSDNYSPFEIDQTLPHQVELGVRSFNNNSEFLPFIKTNGKTTFENQSTFRYNFTYYDLTATENIIANSYYNFLFTNDELKIGLGAFSSMLGRNLYNRNSIMIADKVKISQAGSLEGFASYGFNENKAGGAIGYLHQSDKLNISSSIAYDFDQQRKINTASYLFHSNKIPVAKGHEFSAVVYAYNEEHYYSNKYSLSGIAWDINYFGQISKKLTLQLTNNYGSPNIPGPQMGLLNFTAKANFSTNSRKQFYSFKYANTTKNYYYHNYEGFKLPSSLLHDQYLRILFHSQSSKIHRWSAGPSIEFYNSKKPISDSDHDAIYSIKKYRIEYRSFIGRKLMLSAKTGVGDVYYKEDSEIKDLRYDFHLLGDYNFGGYGIRFAYDYGAMVNTGIYQFAIDASNNSFNLSPYAMKKILKGRINLALFANLAYRFDMKYGTININPKVEAFIFKDWYVVAGGTYSYVNQEFKGSSISANYYYTEFSIKKKWGKTDYKKWQKDLRRIKIVFFQDKNGNGIKDNFEEGIPNVKARLLLINSANQKRTANFPVDLTLLSNDKGNVVFSRIPMGFYDLFITPLTDQKEYFYVSKTAQKIEVTKTNVYYVPFQKATKIEGEINVAHRKYSQEGDHIRDLSNIKVTAFNNLGNSYSAFTRSDGSFTVYAPGNNTYFLRISNVFGKDFRILQNDIKVEVPNPQTVVFMVVENNRRIKFKQAKGKQQEENELQKIKVLTNKIYESKEQRISEQNPIPEFNIKNTSVKKQIIVKNQYYVVVENFKDYENAENFVKILRENGLYCNIGLETENNNIFVFTNYYSSREEAKKEIKKLKASGIKEIEIYFSK